MSESRKKRLRRLSYQVAEAERRRRENMSSQELTPIVDSLATCYERGYKQAMRDLRLAIRSEEELMALAGQDRKTTVHRVTEKFLRGVR